MPRDQSTGETTSSPMSEFCADWSGQGLFAGGAEEFDAIRLEAGGGGDALVEEVIAAIPGAGIAVDVGEHEAGVGANAIAAAKA
jgi:hypothetical protein